MGRTLDRYLLRQVLVPFLLTLLVTTFVLQMPPIALVAEKLLAKGVPAGTVAHLLVTLLPQALAITIPMAFLLGLLMAFGRLSADSEWVALQACGVGLNQLLRPVAVLAFLAWATTSWIIIVALPWGNQAYRDITYGVVATRAETEVRPGVFFEDFPQLVLYVRDVKARGEGWSEVFAADTSNAAQPIIYLARRGRMAVDRATQTVDLVLESGASHATSTDTQGRQQYNLNRFGTLLLKLDPATVFPRGGLLKGDNEMTIAELQAAIRQAREKGASTHNQEMALHQKFSIPFACLVFAVIGLAVGVGSSRGGKLAAFVIGVGVIFAYYVLMYTGRALAKGGSIPAWLAMWIPNIALGVGGVIAFLQRRRSAEGLLRITLPFWWRAAASAGPAPEAAHAGRPVVVVIRLPRINLPLPRVLDVYVSRTYVRLAALTFVSLLGLFYISTFIDLSEKLFKGQTTLGTLAWYFWFQTPQFVYYVVPLSVLIASLVTIGVLTRNSELVVMKACGISLYRVAVPLVVAALAASAALFLLEETVLADSNRRAEELLHVIRGGQPRTFDVLNRRWVVGRGGEIYHYHYYDPRRRELNGLSIYDVDARRWVLTTLTYAGQASWAPTPGAGGRIVPTWRATLGWARALTGASEPGALTTFTERRLTLEPPEYFGTEKPDAERMSYFQLRGYISGLQASGFDVVPLTVELQRKLSFPFVTLVMTLIAVPFAVTTGRHGALHGIGAGIILAITYWITGNLFGAVGAAGVLAPGLAAWAPNLLFGAAAAYLLLTVRT